MLGADGRIAPQSVNVPAIAGLPVDQELGNLEGKELRFGTSAGATYSAVTTAVACGSVNCMHDSLNPLAGITPLAGMWLNCIFGGKGVGMINLLVYLIVGVFLAGLMVGRTPEYLGKKVEAREMKLAMLALLDPPDHDPGTDRTVCGRRLGLQGDQQSRGARLLGNPLRVQLARRPTTARASKGWETPGASTRRRKTTRRQPPTVAHWDIATGLVMLISRFMPIIATIALAGSLAAKKPTPFTAGTCGPTR